jgi:hypothetical protein
MPASAAPDMADLVYGMPVPGVRTTSASLPAVAAPEARVDVRATTPAPRGTAVTPQSLATQNERDAATAAELRTLLSDPDTKTADAALTAAGLTRAAAETRAKDLEAKDKARKTAAANAEAEAAKAAAELAAAERADLEQQALKDAAAAAVLEDLRKAGAGKAGTGLSSSLEERATRAREEAAAAAAGREQQAREEAARAEALRKARAQAERRVGPLPVSPRPRGGAFLPAAERAGATPLTYGAPDTVIPGLTTYGTRPVGEGMPAGPAFYGREETRDIAIDAMPTLPPSALPAEEDMFAGSSITLEPEAPPAKPSAKPAPKAAPAKPAPAKPAPAKPAPAKATPAKPAPPPAPPRPARFTQAEIDAAAQMLED